MEAWNSNKATRPAQYRWFKFWLGAGALLAVLLLFNSIQNYNFVTRRIVVEQVRRELNRSVVALDRQVREAGPDAKLAFPALANSLLKDSIESVEIRDREGNVVAQAGEPSAPAFSQDEIRSRMRQRETLFKVRNTPAGPALVEVMPFRLPGPPGQGFATIQLTASLERATSAVWPVRRNLIINCSAALALLFTIVLIALRFRQYVQGKQLEQQVAIARKVQQALLPSSAATDARISVAAECLPAQGVSGDFYDTFEAAHGRSALVIGDVSGKGIPAALLMGVIHGAVRSSSWADSPRAHEEASRRLNELLCERATGERYATMFWAYYDEARAQLHYVNAGHCAQLLARRGNGTSEVIALDQGGPVLGLLAGARYEQAAVSVTPGDLLVMFSDGLVEAANAASDEFGIERIQEIVNKSTASTAAQLHAEILQALQQFTHGLALHDDLTLMVVQFESRAAFTQEPAFEMEEMAAV